jgi:hypothetical protein
VIAKYILGFSQNILLMKGFGDKRGEVKERGGGIP